MLLSPEMKLNKVNLDKILIKGKTSFDHFEWWCLTSYSSWREGEERREKRKIGCHSILRLKLLCSLSQSCVLTRTQSLWDLLEREVLYYSLNDNWPLHRSEILQVPQWSCNATTPGTHWFKQPKLTKTATSSSKHQRALPPLELTNARPFWLHHHLLRVRNPPAFMVESSVPYSSRRSHTSLRSFLSFSTPLDLLHLSPNAHINEEKWRRKKFSKLKRTMLCLISFFALYLWCFPLSSASWDY